MLPYPKLDPVIFSIGPFALRWYGLMYLLGFGASFFLVKKQIREAGTEADGDYLFLERLVLYMIIGVVAGGRLGYVLFYNLGYYLSTPEEIFALWYGGMSFHGGLVGAILAGWLCVRKYRQDFWKWADRVIVTVPIGLGLGRIGNFINGELYGRPSDVPWAMIFPQGGLVPRHPSQLYEFFLEGVVLFIILWALRRKKWPDGRKLALFLMLYAAARILVEFFREPDAQLGFILWGWVTMGQLLSMILLVAGLLLWKVRSQRV